jgi:hypothetical protein
MQSSSYLTLLPDHPPPETEPIESFTGYLVRLGQLNGIPNITSLAATFFPHATPRIVANMTDLPREDLNVLSARTACPEDKLLETTVYHLVRKFGRRTETKSAGLFLSGAIGRHLRYCPLCIAEKPYYRLYWRFLMLIGCPIHEVKLLDRCGQCQHAIPLIQRNLKIGICPACNADLRACTTHSLTKSELETVTAKWGDLEFLLSPAKWEDTVSNLSDVIGGAYYSERHRRGLTTQQIAQSLGTTHGRIQKLDKGHAQIPVGPFTRYVAYADYFGLSLKVLFGRSVLRKPAFPRGFLNSGVE